MLLPDCRRPNGSCFVLPVPDLRLTKPGLLTTFFQPCLIRHPEDGRAGGISKARKSPRQFLATDAEARLIWQPELINSSVSRRCRKML